MAVEILSGGRVNPLPLPQGAQPPQGDQEETYPQKIGRNVYRGAKNIAKLAGLPGDIAQFVFPEQSKKTLLPTSQGIEEKIFQPLEEKYLPKGYGKPKNDIEDMSDMVATAIPWIVSGGLPLAAARTTSAVGSALGRKGAQKLGGGPIAEFFGGLLGGAAPSLLSRGVGLGGIRSKVIKEADSSYKQAEPVAKSINFPANDYNSSINQDLKQLNSGKLGIGEQDIKRITHEINQLKKDVVGGKINVGTAWDSKKHLWKLIQKERDPEVKKFLTTMRSNVMNTVLDPAAKEYPSFGVPYNRGDNLWIGAYAPNAIRKVLERSTDLESLVTNPLARMGLLGAAGGAIKLAGIKGAAAAAGTALGTRYLLRAGDMFMKSSEARNIMKDIAKAALDENKAAMASNLARFNQVADDYQKQTTGVEFVSGGFNQKSNRPKK